MTLKIFNTYGRKKVEFKPIDKNEVKLYVCGPTVYNFAHIGNFRAYVFGDLLRRYLEYSGFDVKQVMNITDIDDKTIRDSQKAGISLNEFTEKYSKAFFDDLRDLNIEKAEVYPKATDHIDEMVKHVTKLMEKGYAYKGKDNSIYFDISKFEGYGKLSGMDLKNLKSGARVCQDEYTKDEASDFVLWKAWTKEDGEVFWESELGKGRPGWHLECSVMSAKYLGDSFDIHTGGIDLVFPHHENEIAQSEAVSGKHFVNYWMHNEWMLVDGKKMSKSLGNFYTLKDLIKKGFSPKAIRYVLIGSHYRTQMNFTLDSIKDAETTINRLIEFIDKLQELEPSGKYNLELKESIEVTIKEFKKNMDDDLNTPPAIAGIQELVTKTNKAISENNCDQKNLEEVYKTMMDFDKVLGILEHERIEVPQEVRKVLNDREEARATKDFKKSDDLRETIRKLGWEVQDIDGKQVLRKRI